MEARAGKRGSEGTPMLKVAIMEGDGRARVAADGSPIDEVVREGARAMLAAALRVEVAAYVEAPAHQIDGARFENGKLLEREAVSDAAPDVKQTHKETAA